MTKQKNTLIGKIKYAQPKRVMTPEEKKVWQELMDRRFKPFMADMERLEVAAKIDMELIHPETKEKFISQTLTTSYYKRMKK